MLPAKAANIERVTWKHLQILQTDDNVAAKRGSALALSALPSNFLLPYWKDVIDSLCNAIHVEVVAYAWESIGDFRLNSL